MSVVNNKINDWQDTLAKYSFKVTFSSKDRIGHLAEMGKAMGKYVKAVAYRVAIIALNVIKLLYNVGAVIATLGLNKNFRKELISAGKKIIGNALGIITDTAFLAAAEVNLLFGVVIYSTIPQTVSNFFSGSKPTAS